MQTKSLPKLKAFDIYKHCNLIWAYVKVATKPSQDLRSSE